MIIKAIRPKVEAKTFCTINKSIIADSGIMKGPEIEFENGSVLMFISNAVYYNIITNKRYYKKSLDNELYEFDLDQFQTDFLVDEDDLNNIIYRNKKVTGLKIYSITNGIQAFMIEF